MPSITTQIHDELVVESPQDPHETEPPTSTIPEASLSLPAVLWENAHWSTLADMPRQECHRELYWAVPLRAERYVTDLLETEGNHGRSPNSVFQKRHYEALAKVLRSLFGQVPMNVLVSKFAEAFKADNPNFNAERFEAAVHNREWHAKRQPRKPRRL